MRKIAAVCCLFLFTLAFGHRTFAQDTANAQQSPKAQDTAKPPSPPVHYYHLDFVVEELGSDGKPVNSRTYSTAVSTDRSTMSIRTGSRIPIVIGSTENNGKENQQIQYQDVGINIDVRDAREVDGRLALYLSADLTGLAQPIDPSLHQPVMRQNRWQASILIPVGKPSVVFTSDSIDSKGSTRVTVTATPLQ
ncbi:MAG TPA: hypothetical protein VH308_04875 [Terracidiphilus sp.]|jgi:hypothetical protein|nr:hypothetical protein [Terracidiphilus sp.]